MWATKEQARLYNKKYRLEHKHKLSLKGKEYRLAHKERVQLYAQQYRETHRAELNQKNREYYHTHQQENIIKHRQYYLSHKTEVRKAQKLYAQTHKETMRATALRLSHRRKLETLTHYGNGKCACVKCGFDDIRALSINHINGKGTQHRKQLITQGHYAFYVWLKQNNFPEGYETLCMNCQWIDRFTSNRHN